MKISELEERLAALKAEHGDIPVGIIHAQFHCEPEPEVTHLYRHRDGDLIDYDLHQLDTKVKVVTL